MDEVKSLDMIQYIKKVVSLVIGSGFLLSASYIYGWGFYQGYLEQFGFEYILFPVEWNNSPFWAYYASRALGVDSMEIYAKSSPLLFSSLVISCYVFIVWFGNSSSKRKRTYSDIRKRKVKFIKFRNRQPNLVKFILNKVVWFFTNRYSVKGLIAAYLLFVFILLVPILLYLWSFFPLFGSEHGRSFVADYQERLPDNFCTEFKGKWSPCVKIELDNQSFYEGIMIIKNGNLVGLYTEKGPVMVTLPSKLVIKRTLRG